MAASEQERLRCGSLYGAEKEVSVEESGASKTLNEGV